MSWVPVRRSSSEKAVLVPAAIILRPKPAPGTGGRSSSRSARPSMKRVMRAGASRKSRAFCDGGVSSTIDVEGAVLDQLVQPLDRHVVLGPGDGAGQVAVDPVGEDPLARLGGRGLARDQAVEGRLRVELERPELGAARPGLGRHAPRLVGQALHPEGGGEPPRRVDRHHHGPRPAAGQAQAEPGRDGRLADAAGPAADDDPATLDRLDHGRPFRETAPASAPASSSRAARSNRRRTSSGSSSTGRPVPSASRRR